MTAKPRLVAVVRISKNRAGQQSTENQPYDMTQWADRHGMEIIETFTEVGKSGYKDIPRPYLDDALAMVKHGLADGIIVWKIDRFTRKGAIEIFRMLAVVMEGNGFLVATEDAIDTRNGDMASIIKLTVIAETAKAESDAKSERAKSWHRGRLRANESRTHALPPVGRRPFGYDRPNANTLAINEAEAECIRQMARDFIAGKSMRAIVAEMNASGIRKDGKPWTHRGVGYIFRSPTVIGGRMVDGKFAAGDWPAILDMETWKRCGAILADPSRRTITTNEPAWLLTGIARCGRCDGGIRAKNHAKTGKRYTCKDCGCSMVLAIADAVVEGIVLDMLAGDSWKALRASGRTHDADAIQFLTDRLAHAKQRWMDGKDSDADYDETKDAINARLDAIKSAPIVELPEVEDLAEAWNHPTNPLPLVGKRQVIAAACKSIAIVPMRPGMEQVDRIIVEEMDAANA